MVPPQHGLNVPMNLVRHLGVGSLLTEGTNKWWHLPVATHLRYQNEPSLTFTVPIGDLHLMSSETVNSVDIGTVVTGHTD